MDVKKTLLVVLGAALLSMILACTGPTFRRGIHDPVKSTEEIQAAMERLHQINLTVGTSDFDPSVYPVSVGIDARNGKMLIEKFICWDICPDVGMVFLMYQGVDSVEACADSVVGAPLISPDPIPGEFWGCRPIVDWLNPPGRLPR